MNRIPILAAALLIAPSATAQTAPGIAGEAMTGSGSVLPATSTITGKTIKVPVQMTLCISGANYVACPAGGKQESFQLVATNTPSAAATVFGGDYILSQTCTGYGTLKLQVLGPDATTWLDLLTKTATDGGSGTGLALGSYAQVRVTVTGTTGCNALLARVPA